MAGELAAVIQYLTYAAKATGPYRPQLVNFFMAEIPDETAHAQFLANKIVALGGEPTTVPATIPAAKTNREMLECVRNAEQEAIQNYIARAKQAEELGEKGPQVQLEDMVRDETGHFEETERMLREWHLWLIHLSARRPALLPIKEPVECRARITGGVAFHRQISRRHFHFILAK